ncbi:MAG TPA: cupin domain-containing protein [Gaiellaceae bacterium]|nr:cupin domain-containing protein [Gaiellaceae bacterium]
MEEAGLERKEGGLVPRGEGWFVVNAREARWLESPEFGAYVPFEGEERFAQLGLNIGVLQPGQPACLYHGESGQEAFLVLAGECLLLVEGEERLLRAWDFFHCPPWTEHVLVGAGEEPCVVLAAGARLEGSAVRYPVSALAGRHGASAEEETGSPREAYAPFSVPVARPYRDGDLPTL